MHAVTTNVLLVVDASANLRQSRPRRTPGPTVLAQRALDDAQALGGSRLPALDRLSSGTDLGIIVQVIPRIASAAGGFSLGLYAMQYIA
jgi:hypothetical protein